MHPEAAAPQSPTWPLSEGAQRSIAVRWPSRYEWPAASRWVDGLHDALRRLVRVERAELEQPYEGVVLIQVRVDETWHDVAIDYFDLDRVLEEVATRCPLVFKMQYRGTGYGVKHIVPGGYVPGRRYLDRLLPGLRHAGTRPPRFEVYGRFGAVHALDTRARAVAALQTQQVFAYEGSMAVRPYAAYLREAARSRVCIDLPGNGDLTHRLVDYLAVGCCVVRPRPTVVLPVPLRDGREAVFVDDVGSELVEACVALLHEPDRCAVIAEAARTYFDRHLRSDQLAGYYVDRCRVILGAL